MPIVQLGLAAADSKSGDVDVTSLEELTAGEDGIVAELKAVAVADLDQKADQENEADMSAEESAAALQGQLVGQLNFNVQAGAAIASADSGDVDVEQDGVLTAGAGGTTGDGITAESKAVAVAKLEQDADQKNDTSAAAELENPDRIVVIGETQGLPLTIEAVGLQGQLIGQLNLNAQLGLAVADADSGDVDVKSYQDPSLGNGITAEIDCRCQGRAHSRYRPEQRERGEHHLARVVACYGFESRSDRAHCSPSRWRLLPSLKRCCKRI